MEKAAHHRIPATRDEREYLVAVRRSIRNSGLVELTPKMSQGDVLIFDGEMVHGSHVNQHPELTRHSMTGFYYPASSRMKAQTIEVNGLHVADDPFKYIRANS